MNNDRLVYQLIVDGLQDANVVDYPPKSQLELEQLADIIFDHVIGYVVARDQTAPRRRWWRTGYVASRYRAVMRR